MMHWVEENYRDIVRLSIHQSESLFSGRSEFQQVDIFESDFFGRVLMLDGYFMTSDRDEYFYHEMLVHPAMMLAPKIEQVLIIGGGDGGTAREVLRYDEVKSVTMVEIDGLVIQKCKELMPSIGRNAWQDSRLKVIVGDAIEFVRQAEQNMYDVVLLDGTDPVGPGKGLYHNSFYDNCRKVLHKDGIFGLQSESPFLMQDSFMKVMQGLPQSFKKVSPYFGPTPIYNSGTWSWTLAANNLEHNGYDERRMIQIEKGCKYYNRDIHIGAFAMPNYVRQLLRA